MMVQKTRPSKPRLLGYTSEQIRACHGFRAMARTILDEKLGYPTKYIKQRHDMMQHWSDYLDSLRVGNVVSVKFGGVV